jgi:hypothetical protein
MMALVLQVSKKHVNIYPKNPLTGNNIKRETEYLLQFWIYSNYFISIDQGNNRQYETEFYFA